jgi:non-specific serine/threonine protein kinase/serine/threonine-protein kinase
VTPERWQQVKAIFHAAADQKEQERDVFLASACEGNVELRSEVESLLASMEQPDALIDAPPMLGAAAQWLAGNHADPVLGRTIGSYQIVRLIGRGGMGAVYLAERSDQQYRKQVAIKLVRPGIDRDQLLPRFLRERQVLATLDHPGIAKLLDGGATEDGLPYLIMDFVEGVPIDKYCDTHKLSTVERLRLFRSVCAAVQCAHQNLVVHRDLKPSNILITADGQPKLLDFGIAKLLEGEEGVEVTLTEYRVLTPEYASPEQVRGGPITTASDVYSLGIVLYELLTGHHPYRLPTKSAAEMERAICEEEPERPSTAMDRVIERKTDQGTASVTPETVSQTRDGRPDRLRRNLSGDLDNIVLMALRKEPQRRYVSVDQFSEDIRRHLEALPVIARKDTWRYRAGKFVRRHKTGVGAAVLVAVSLVAGTVGTAWQAQVARAEKRRAEQRFNDVRKLATSFLFDFHDAIKNLPGSTPARQMVVKKALEHLDKLAAEAASDASLQDELAEAYLKVGDVQGFPYSANLGDTEGALASYRKAQSLAKGILRVDPNNLSARRHLARSYQCTGQLMTERVSPAEAVAGLRQAIAIHESIVAANPKSVVDLLNLADGYDSLADRLGNTMFLNRGDRTAVLAAYRKALEIDLRAADLEPANRRAQRSLAVGYAKLGDCLSDSTELGRAVDEYKRSLEQFQALAASDPLSTLARGDVAKLNQRLGSTLKEAGRYQESLAVFRQALEFHSALAAADPANAAAKTSVYIVRKDIGELLGRMGDIDGAIANYRQAITILEELSAADPANTLTRSRLAEILVDLGEKLAQRGEGEEARQLSVRGLAGLKAQAQPASATANQLYSYAQALLTCVPLDLRNADEAVAIAERAAELSKGQDPDILDALARAYFQTGNHKGAVETEQKALTLLPSTLPGSRSLPQRQNMEANLARFQSASSGH